MANDIPTGEESLETWLVDSSGNIAVSSTGLALLEAQITPRHDAGTDGTNPLSQARDED